MSQDESQVNVIATVLLGAMSQKYTFPYGRDKLNVAGNSTHVHKKLTPFHIVIVHLHTGDFNPLQCIHIVGQPLNTMPIDSRDTMGITHGILISNTCFLCQGKKTNHTHEQ